MRAQIQKWGNSLGIRIPMVMGKKLHLHPGSLIVIELEDDRLIIQTPKYNLETLLNQITPENQHHQLLDDIRYGNEEW